MMYRQKTPFVTKFWLRNLFVAKFSLPKRCESFNYTVAILFRINLFLS